MKFEKACKAGDPSATGKHALNKAEQRVYNNLKQSLKEIKLHQQGKIELRDAKEFLTTL